jgi:hypothetical protein
MQRYDDWEKRLNKALEEKREQSFEWGVNDCALFASDLMESITGTDPAEWFRSEYSTEKGAYKALKRSPFSNNAKDFNKLFTSVVSELSKQNGMDAIGPNFMQRGDLALVKQQNDLLAMGIFVGNGVACAKEPKGYELMSVEKVQKAWRVPY